MKADILRLFLSRLWYAFSSSQYFFAFIASLLRWPSALARRKLRQSMKLPLNALSISLEESSLPAAPVVVASSGVSCSRSSPSSEHWDSCRLSSQSLFLSFSIDFFAFEGDRSCSGLFLLLFAFSFGNGFVVFPWSSFIQSVDCFFDDY